MRAGYFRTRCDSTRVPSRRVLNSLLPKALLVQARIEAIFGHQGLMGTRGHNPPLIHHDNEIRTLHSGEPVCDHQRGSTGRHLLQ